jgi:hypothetical protein
MLNEVDDELIDRFVERIVGAPILSAEIRHLGGAVARRSSQHGALNSFDAPYLMFSVGLTPTPELLEVVEAVVADLRQTLFASESYHRLRRIKAIVDPTDLVRSNHPIPPAF